MPRQEIERKTLSAHDVIGTLANQTQRPVDEVKAIYESQLARLQAGARVKSYLVLLATRRAKEILTKHW